jgi:acetyltransferase-like isoleucine patch superfamily enzyme
MDMILLNFVNKKIKSSKMSKIIETHDNVNLSIDAIIEGTEKTIRIGAGTEIEPGVVLSTKHGGTITLGKNCVIRRGAMLLTYVGNIVLGDYCGINLYTILYGHGGLLIGDYVQLAAHCVVIPANHGYDSLDIPIWKQPLSKKGITVEFDVWIGANVSILDGVKIGKGAVVGAGSVITKDVLPFTINAGNPSKMLKSRLDRTP